MPKFDIYIAKRNIRDLMKKSGVSQEELCSAIGMSQPNLSKALSEKSSRFMSVERICDIAEYFKVPVDSLLGRTAFTADSLSLRHVARFIASYMDRGDLVVHPITVKEDVNIVHWNDFYNEPDFEQGNKDIEYPALYFRNFWQIADHYTGDPEELAELQAEYYQVGNETRYVPLNTFIREYANILRLHRTGQLSNTACSAMVEGLLSQLPE